MKKVLQRHAEMVFDMARSAPLLRAIEKKVEPGDIVVDVGCGIGLLSFAAVHAGAKRVYAIDVDSEALEFAQWQAKQLGMEKKICFLEDHSFHVELLSQADLLIQETVGPLAFDENFLTTLEDAKRRFLKPKGKIIPEEVSLYGAPVDGKKNLLAKPSLLLKIKTDKPCKKCIDGIRIRKSVGPLREVPLSHTPCTGILLWPHIVWAKGCITDCSPLKKPTHWHQTFLAISPPPLPSREGTRGRGQSLKFQLNIFPHPKNPLHYSEIEWQILTSQKNKKT